MTETIKKTKIMEITFIGILSAGFLLTPQSALSQVEEEEIEEVIEELEEAVEEIGEELEPVFKELPGLLKVNKVHAIGLGEAREERSGVPKLGLYLDDMSFKEAYETHYPENYGVMIDDVIRGGNADRAGLRDGDIIMEFNGERVRYEDHLLRMRDSKKIGDTVSISFFRDERRMTTELTFYPSIEISEEREEVSVMKKRLSPGYGGGLFEPVIIEFDFEGINDFLDVNGFDKITEPYVVAFGGGGMGNVGKGWFIGGMGAGFEKRQQVPVKDSEGLITGQKLYKLTSAFGGVTLNKKYPLFTERMVLDLGIMMGGGGTELIVSQTDGDLTWSDNISGKNTYSIRFYKTYFAYRPSVGLLVRIKNWVGIHGSMGYLGTYAPDDKWTERPFNFTVGGASPVVPSGPSYTLGFWFGF